MATASHDHIPDLSASLSKSHHHVPISDLWGLSLNQKSSTSPKQDKDSDYALEIARGPLMSSASSAQLHENTLDDQVKHDELSNSAVRPQHSRQSSQSHPQSSGFSKLTQNTPAYPVQLGSTPLGGTVKTGSAPPGMGGNVNGNVVVPQSSSTASTFRSGIWGPRQNFSTFNAPGSFTQSAPPTSNVGSVAPPVYGNIQWSLEAPSSAPNVSSTVANVPTVPGVHQGVPVSQPGYYTIPPSLMQKAPSPPHGSPSLRSQSNGAAPIMPASHPHQHLGAAHGGHVPSGPLHHHENRPPKKNGRPSTNTELYKTELCASFMSTGGNCPYGEKCQFAHGTQELKSVDRPPKWRSKPCQNWVKTGTCSYNERCCFRHDVPVGHTP